MKTDFLIEQTTQRIVQLENNIHHLISEIDMGVSNVYGKDSTTKSISQLINILGQMDADLVALAELLDD